MEYGDSPDIDPEDPSSLDAFIANQPHMPEVEPAVFAAWRERQDPMAAMQIMQRYGQYALRIAGYCANKLLADTTAINEEDLAQEALISLLYGAASTYTARDDASFSTYATYRIRGDVIRHVQNMASTIRIPVSVQARLEKIRQADQKRLMAGRQPLNDQEAAELVGVQAEGPAFSHGAGGSPLTIATLRIVSAIRNPVTLAPGEVKNRRSGAHPFPGAKVHPETEGALLIGGEPGETPEELAIRLDQRQLTQEIIDEAFGLSPEDIDVVASLPEGPRRLAHQRLALEFQHGLRDFEETSMEHLAARLGISRERLRQRYWQAIGTLRKRFEARDLGQDDA